MGKKTRTQKITATHLRAEGSAGGPEMGLPVPPAPAGGGVEVLACIVPGREPCFFLPGTPRWPPGARGLSKQTKDLWPEKQSGGGQSAEAPARVGLSSGLQPPRHTRRRQEEGRAPRATVPGSVPPTLSSVGARGKTMPNYWMGRRRAGRIGLLSDRSQAAEQARSGTGPLDLQGLGPPQVGAPRPPAHRWRVWGHFPASGNRPASWRQAQFTRRQRTPWWPGPGERTKGNQGELPRASPAVARAPPARDGKEGATWRPRRRCRRRSPGCRGGPLHVHRLSYSAKRAGVSRVGWRGGGRRHPRASVPPWDSKGQGEGGDSQTPYSSSENWGGKGEIWVRVCLARRRASAQIHFYRGLCGVMRSHKSHLSREWPVLAEWKCGIDPFNGNALRRYWQVVVTCHITN